MDPIPDRKGVSPVIAIILMVAITIILSGVVILWVFALSNVDDEDLTPHLFDVELDGTQDIIMVSIIKGNVLNTTEIRGIIDGTSFIFPIEEINAGEELIVSSPIDMTPGDYYNIIIIHNNRQVFNHDEIASP